MKNDPTQAKKYERIRPALNILMDQAKEIMNSTYRYVDGEERLYLSDDRYVKSTSRPLVSRKWCGYSTFSFTICRKIKDFPDY